MRNIALLASRSEKLGIPTDSAESFELLIKAGLDDLLAFAQLCLGR